ncbi:serine/threonine protein kinase [Haliangium ochraceum]|uniref:serine/threonine protein kinase n=1 Tax=Haliangium ochraceum TaxID=80816 RepID=UPI0018EF4231|nr:serine/threonine-protein kinase [Haliangium ochraceum]
MPTLTPPTRARPRPATRDSDLDPTSVHWSPSFEPGDDDPVRSGDATVVMSADASAHFSGMHSALSSSGAGHAQAGAADDEVSEADTQAVDASRVLSQQPLKPAYDSQKIAIPVRAADEAAAHADADATDVEQDQENSKEETISAEPVAIEAPQRSARPGDIIHHKYHVEGQIGRGGMGRVLRVRHQELGRAFALKLIKAPIATDPRIREMFHREATLASSLAHENICSIFDFGTDEVFGLFMVMELLEGQTLFHRLYHKGRFAPKVACDIIWQIAEALRYIHDQSIVHGDIKSENILITRTPERRRVPKLLDFGLARANVQPQGGQIEGTPEYLAPERIYGGPPSHASDIYALGLLFYELLVGRLPFRGSIEQVFEMQIRHPVPKVSEQLQGGIDERVDELIGRATAKRPEERHSDVAAFMYELRTLMSMLGMPLPGRVRGRASADAARAGRTRSRAVSAQRAKAPAEIFEHMPLPVASLEPDSKVRTANLAFWKFLGIDEPSLPLPLSSSPLIDFYPQLVDDLKEVASLRSTVKRILVLDGGSAAVEVAVILTAAPATATATAGEIYITLHPLGRADGR